MANYVSFVEPKRLRIRTLRVCHDYTVEVWWSRNGTHTINLYRTDGLAVYTITISPHVNPRNAVWRCDCPASQYRGGQCKHVLAIKAGLRRVGCKV